MSVSQISNGTNSTSQTMEASTIASSTEVSLDHNLIDPTLFNGISTQDLEYSATPPNFPDGSIPMNSSETPAATAPPATSPAEIRENRRLNKEKQKKKRIRVSETAANNDEIGDAQTIALIFQRKVRWMYLCFFNGDDLVNVIRQVYGEVSQDDTTFRVAREKILNMIKGWKNKAVERLLEHVRNEKDKSRKDNPTFNMSTATDAAPLYQFFLGRNPFTRTFWLGRW